MARRTEPIQQVTNAILAEKLDTLTKTVGALDSTTDAGFKRVHERQDITNGKVIRANDEIMTLTAKFQYNRIIWYLLTVSVSVIIALASFILFKT
jgi:hypothetical protein